MAGPVSAAEEKLRAGELPACLLELQADVRRNPADPKLRLVRIDPLPQLFA